MIHKMWRVVLRVRDDSGLSGGRLETCFTGRKPTPEDVVSAFSDGLPDNLRVKIMEEKYTVMEEQLVMLDSDRCTLERG